MRQHMLVGRLGQDDTVRIDTLPGFARNEFNIMGTPSTLQAIEDLKSLQLYPSRIGFDIFMLAALIHAADTRISRWSESQDSWTREIAIDVPVSDPDRWNRTSSILVRLLNFLTGDKWKVNFHIWPSNFTRPIQFRPQQTDAASPFTSISLFSGGLDSLIGGINLLEQGIKPLFVSHCSDGATSEAQHSCFETIKSHYGNRVIERLRVWFTFHKDLIRGSAVEKTTRARSFLFFGLGTLAGSCLSDDVIIYVAENGLISLNPPLDVLRLGSLSTRTTHTFTMSRWNDLMEILETNCRIENPYRYMTKGEMATRCLNGDLLRMLIRNTMSCASPTKGRWQGIGIQHCGFCVPCLIRRAALLSAGIEDTTEYTLQDLTGDVIDTTRSEGQQIRSFQLLSSRLARNPELARFLIHKSGSLSDDAEHLDDLADVYRRGLEEMATLLHNATTRPR